jgi:hypothetical protein
MTRLGKMLLFAAFLSALCAVGTQSQGSSPTYTAASCNYSDVNAVINGPTHTAVNGDTIQIPAGTCTWNSTLNITVNITIQGEGAEYATAGGASTTGSDQTTLTDNEGGKSLFALTTSAGQFSRITGIAFIQSSSSGADGGGMIAINGSSSSVRVDHCHFYSYVSGNKGIVVGGSVLGVADHNFFDALTGIITNDLAFYNGNGWNGGSSTDQGDASWADTEHWGTSEFFYVEDTYFNNGWVSDCVNGGRYVVRYSTANNVGGLASHGLSGGSNRGCRAGEIYYSTYTFTSNFGQNHSGSVSNSNSGPILAWGITCRGYTAVVNTSMERVLAGMGRDSEEVPAVPNGWGYCGPPYTTGTATTRSGSSTVTGSNFSTSWPANTLIIIPGAECIGQFGDSGSTCKIASVASSTSLTLASAAGASVSGAAYAVGSPWDGNTNSLGYPCLDSPGRGVGDLLNGQNFPNRADTVAPQTQRWPNQALSPIYAWNNTYSPPGTGGEAIVYDVSGVLSDNRDYYQQFGSYGESGSFNGTKGVGLGSLPPTNSSAYSNAPNCSSSTYPGPGYWDTTNTTLYVCTAANTWTTYYTPYTYPHPLTAGGGSGDPVNPPTNVKAALD